MLMSLRVKTSNCRNPLLTHVICVTSSAHQAFPAALQTFSVLGVLGVLRCISCTSAVRSDTVQRAAKEPWHPAGTIAGAGGEWGEVGGLYLKKENAAQQSTGGQSITARRLGGGKDGRANNGRQRCGDGGDGGGGGRGGGGGGQREAFSLSTRSSKDDANAMNPREIEHLRRKTQPRLRPLRRTVSQGEERERTARSTLQTQSEPRLRWNNGRERRGEESRAPTSRRVSGRGAWSSPRSAPLELRLASGSPTSLCARVYARECC
ncbi:hypothetical protein AOLI_G00030240 [Acnodon oligacanthus]